MTHSPGNLYHFEVSIVISPSIAQEAAGGAFGVLSPPPPTSTTTTTTADKMLNSLEALAGKISPGSGKNSPSGPNGAGGLLAAGGELIDSNGNNKLLSGYHHRTKLPYQKPGLSNNNNNCNVVNNTPAAAGAGSILAGAIPEDIWARPGRIDNRLASILEVD
ncbi:hypothetical protein ZHAS_00007315 [Anopheles sinensis]|uniref:Uncharacterized protein n=1 Tax=Anopheles sinensis TaxID=74873 RepID=A0A084VPP0_ANOSI|nr:hypothetical protein ZHAS_00007315 [Anopheles sinensis]